MGHVFSVLLYSLIGFSAFILVDVRPFRHLLDDTIKFIGGAFIPIAILPAPIREIASVLPFRFLYSFQLEMLLAPADKARVAEGFVISLLWISLLAITNISLFGIAFERSAPRW
jgi:ABC-2 type transport system permease protein